ncbi:MAG: hypothetical protein LIP77_05950, partial [Planctomycetes bacterium]|nr:hypothetical protein [Planctomycetota bacterium]
MTDQFAAADAVQRRSVIRYVLILDDLVENRSGVPTTKVLVHPDPSTQIRHPPRTTQPFQWEPVGSTETLEACRAIVNGVPVE